MRLYVLSESEEKNSLLAVSHVLSHKKYATVIKMDPTHGSVFVTMVSSEDESDKYADPELQEAIRVKDKSIVKKSKKAKRTSTTPVDWRDQSMQQLYACVMYILPKQIHATRLLIPITEEAEIRQVVDFVAQAFGITDEHFCITPGSQPTDEEMIAIANTGRRFDELATEYWNREDAEDGGDALATELWTAFFRRIEKTTTAFTKIEENRRIVEKLGIDPWVGAQLNWPVFEQFRDITADSADPASERWVTIYEAMLQAHDAKYGRTVPELQAYYDELVSRFPWFTKVLELLGLQLEYGETPITYKRLQQNVRIYHKLRLKKKFKNDKQAILLDAYDVERRKWLPLNEALIAAAAREPAEGEPQWLPLARKLHRKYKHHDTAPLETLTGRTQRALGDGEEFSVDDDDDDSGSYSFAQSSYDSAEFKSDSLHSDDSEFLKARLKAEKRKLKEHEARKAIKKARALDGSAVEPETEASSLGVLADTAAAAAAAATAVPASDLAVAAAGPDADLN
jgi:hypothetical protein